MRFEVGLPPKGCEVRNHVIRETSESIKSQQRIKVSDLNLI